jgi:hypothetical protein
MIVATILSIAGSDSTCLRWKVGESLVEKCTFPTTDGNHRLEVLRPMAEAIPT